MRKLRTAFLSAALALLSAPAFGGDFSHFQLIGFSEDGGIFAFEEYGVQDGSGLPYSNIFFIDTEKDQYLPETPYRVQMKEGDDTSLASARSQAYAQASALIVEHGMTGHTGEIVAFNPQSELGTDGKTIRYRPFSSDPPIDATYAMKIEDVGLPPYSSCKDITPDNAAGFRLTLTERAGKPASEVIHEDDRIPESRKCPVGYRLGGVVSYYPPSRDLLNIALVQVLSYGFEGRDGRWIAVPVRP
jgi:predicted secreted protein